MTTGDHNSTSVFRALIRMRTEEEIGFEGKLRVGFSGSLRFKGKYYPSKIVECAKEITSGQEGMVTFYMIDSVPEGSELAEGSVFDVTRGPRVLIATGRVTDVIERPQ